MIDDELKPFPELIGHEGIKEKIYSMLQSGNIPHAFLFSGNEGVGKFAFAIEIIRYLNLRKTENKEYVEKQISLLSEPFIHYIFPLPRGKNETVSDNPYAALSDDVMEEINKAISEKSRNPYYEINIHSAQNIKISSIRALKKNLSIKTSDIPYKGIIIERAEQMSVEAQNSLLKSLEEPPEGVIFFLLTKDENLLLPTINSRCWNVKFGNLKKNEIEKILIKYFDIESETAKKIAPFSVGSIKVATKLLNENSLEILEKTIDFLRKTVVKKYNNALKILSEILDNTNNDLEFVINLINLWLEDSLISRFSDLNVFSFDEYKDTFINFNRAFPNANAQKIIDDLQRLIILHKQNVSLKIILLNVIFIISSLGERQI